MTLYLADQGHTYVNVIIAPSVGYFTGRNSNQNKHKHTQKFSAKIVFQKLKAQTEASDIVAKVKLKK